MLVAYAREHKVIFNSKFLL